MTAKTIYLDVLAQWTAIDPAASIQDGPLKGPLTFPPLYLDHSHDVEEIDMTWRTYSARFTIYLPEFRLLELCARVVRSQPGIALVLWRTGQVGFLPPDLSPRLRQAEQYEGASAYDESLFHRTPIGQPSSTGSP